MRRVWVRIKQSSRGVLHRYGERVCDDAIPKSAKQGSLHKRVVPADPRSGLASTRCVSCRPWERQLMTFLGPRPCLPFVRERLRNHEIVPEFEDDALPNERHTRPCMASSVRHWLLPCEIHRIRSGLDRQPIHSERAVRSPSGEPRNRDGPRLHRHTVLSPLPLLLSQKLHVCQRYPHEYHVEPRSIVWSWHLTLPVTIQEYQIPDFIDEIGIFR